MLTFKKDGGTKIVSEENQSFIDLIKSHGWVEETKEKEIKNGKSSKSGGKSGLSDSAE